MFLLLRVFAFIDADAAHDRSSTANTAVPAEFAGLLAAERFIGNAGLNKVFWGGIFAGGIWGGMELLRVGR
ncbi:MAG: hypothetical protein JXB10_15935, partial [Pirellulales bacterium]|nr:hypothetical protein [Pirellulales bacterium]